MSSEVETEISGTGSEDEEPTTPSKTLERSSTNVVSDDFGLTPEFRKLLECPACEEIGIPPIYLCEKGHSLCSQCRHSHPTCPKCSAPITEMRNEMAESIVAKFTFKCPYFQDGCRLITDGKTLGKHLIGCPFRPITCDVSSGIGCGKRMGCLKYADHVISEHGVTGLATHQAVISMSTSVKLGQNNWTFPPHFLKVYGQTFLCYVHASYNVLIAWVALCGHASQMNDYVSAVTIFDPKKRFLQAKWIGQVHSIRTSAKQVYNSGNCLALLPESFLLFTEVEVEPNGRRVKKWKCHFEVIKVDQADTEGPFIETIVDSTSMAENEPTDADLSMQKELLLSNTNPSKLNNPEISLEVQEKKSTLMKMKIRDGSRPMDKTPFFQDSEEDDQESVENENESSDIESYITQ